MKTVKESILDRRSIRRYEREAVTTEQMQLIYRAIQNTPTSYNGQQFSVIDIDDQALKEKLYEISGAKQIKTCSHFLIFIIDYHKMQELAQAKGVEMPEFYNTADGLIVGLLDPALALMNALTMAESLGLGTCPVGYIRTVAPHQVNELLHLPQHTFMACGLAIGVPREMPDMKPKQPIETLIFHNQYPSESLVPELSAYDAEIKKYNQERAGHKTDNDWCEHIIGYYREAMNYEMLAALKAQGFDIKK